MNEFFNWLSSHKDGEVVGLPGRCFDSPLSRWLSTMTGRLVGVDGARYGWALMDACRWRKLPYWAQVFAALCESRFGRSLTAYEAVDLLAQVETMIAPAVWLVA